MLEIIYSKRPKINACKNNISTNGLIITIEIRKNRAVSIVPINSNHIIGQAMDIEGYSDIVNAVFFNLVIYNLTNEITDCLIIDSRYNFEIDYFKKVNVNNNCEIEVIHYQNNQLEKKCLFKISNKGAFEEIIN